MIVSITVLGQAHQNAWDNAWAQLCLTCAVLRQHVVWHLRVVILVQVSQASHIFSLAKSEVHGPHP